MQKVLYGAFYVGAILNIAFFSVAMFLSADSGLITPDNTDFAFRTSSAVFYFITLFAAGSSSGFAATALWFDVPGRWIWVAALAAPLIAVLIYRDHLCDLYPPWSWPERAEWLEQHNGRMPDYYYRDNGILFPEENRDVE